MASSFQGQSYTQRNYKMSDLGGLALCLGIHFTQCQDSLGLTPRTYILKMLQKFGIEAKNLARLLHLFISRKITCQKEPSSSEEDTQKSQKNNGSLMYAAIATRPDIVFVSSDLSKCVWNLAKNHLVLRHFQFSRGLSSGVSSRRSDRDFIPGGYCAASWNCQEDSYSSTGFVSQFLTRPLTWWEKTTSNSCIYCWSWVRLL